MDVQAVRSSADGQLSYAVLGADLRPVDEIDRFLVYLTNIGRSPNTIRAYARDVADLFEWTRLQQRDWRTLDIEDIAHWVSWLRLPLETRTAPVSVLPMVKPAVTVHTLRRKLASVDTFYVFHARRDETVRMCLSRWHPGGRRTYKPFLAHLQSGRLRKEIQLGAAIDPFPQIVGREDMGRLVGACRLVRDRFLLNLLFETGARIGEALGMRHEDLNIAKGEVQIEPRLNENGARVKRWKPRTVPVNTELFALYADYMDLEYGAIDSDYLFVNLVRGQRGSPMTYGCVRQLVLRLREATGLSSFTPHQLRHTFAHDLLTRNTDWHVVQLLLGHSSVQTTLNIYGHLTAADTRKALIDAGWLAQEEEQ
ncbi:integrase [Mycobacteroides stephanolepidis]|uniref:Integrase n=1 Tax=[Mycobacterium] stephanolepidis TaxID=1520670 RepID=A0A1Z4EY99_9MYCO|nr:tyrosine-type recombinase/integrase [[Mycobacterium] stephanolepidis]BAX97945.1 integrase [[Mycobacterium] stephanolepidis]